MFTFPAAEEPRDEPDYTREKNRLHYVHQRIFIDLTQVHAPDGQGKVSALLRVCPSLTVFPAHQ